MPSFIQLGPLRFCCAARQFSKYGCQLAKQVLLFGRTCSSRQPLETALRNDICCEKAIDACPLRGGAALPELSWSICAPYVPRTGRGARRRSFLKSLTIMIELLQSK